ncbi:MAG TPA: ABC transporter permease [Bryobacteraceae bacterium]
MSRFRLRLRYLAQYGERQQSLWEEMEFHVESKAQDLISAGMPEQEARAAAHREFGNMTRQSEDARATWIARWLSDAVQDLKHTFRGMRRDAGFATFVILIAGLGIGASSTIFSVVNALLLRQLPFANPRQLVWIANEEWSTQVSEFLDLRDHNRSFTDLAGFAGVHVDSTTLSGAGEPERLTNVPVTQNFFALLGVKPIVGRSFTSEECHVKVASPPAAVLSYGFWQRRFASDPAVVGRTLTLNNKPVTVIGVLPQSFDFGSLFAPGQPVDLFLPWPLTNETDHFGNTMSVIGRLAPGASVQSAQAEFTIIGKQLGIEHPERNGVTPKLAALQEHISGRVSAALMVLLCAVGVVMLIVCANLSNMQLARLGTRRKEMAMRAALGGGRFRLLRQMLTESIALSCCGAALGLILATAGTRLIAHLDAFNIPLLASVRVDAKALEFALLAAVVTGVLFGLLPALQVPSFAIGAALRDGGRASSGKGHAWVRSALVVSEIAFACTLLVGAGLLLRSFLRVLNVNPGFQPENAYALRIDPSFRLSGLPQQNSWMDEVLRRVRALPGMRAAGVADILPLDGDRSWQVTGRGQVYPKNHHPEAYIRVASDGYFEATGVRVLKGRGFTEADRASSEPVAIVNETLARTLWPGQDAIGQFLTQDGGRRVVGVVEDVRHASLETAGGSELYLPIRQTGDYAAINLVVRTTLSPEHFAPEVRAALRQIDKNMPLPQIEGLQELVDKSVSPRRFLVLMLGGFAGFALLLAAVGTYAVISHSVNQRVLEIGIRMALGASATNLQSRILLNTLGLVGAGLVLGMAASGALTGLLQGLLFGVTPGDPVTFIGIAAMLIAVAALAGYLPARRASRIDPMVALRAS